MAYQPGCVPGPLQIAEYAHHLVSSDHSGRTDVAEAVAARMQRQVILQDRSKRLRWVIGETGLRWRMGPPPVMSAQLERLATWAAQPHLDLRVLPFARTAPVWVPHGFTVHADRVDGEPDLVNIEPHTGASRS